MNVVIPNKILIVEDCAIFRKLLTRRLEEQGYEVIQAQDGIEGLQKARTQNPDLIILDLMLPRLNGHKICRLLKFDRNLGCIPVIIITSRDSDEDAELAKQSRADAFIIKTVRFEIVLDVIERLLKKSQGKNNLSISFPLPEEPSGCELSVQEINAEI